MADKTWTIDSSGWVRGKLFGYTVEVRPMPRPGNAPFVPLTSAAKLGNHHTTEGTTVDGAFNTLVGIGVGCWIVGQDRILQGRPIGFQGSALRTPDGGPYPNSYCKIEVEQVAFSKTSLWLPAESTLGPMAAVMAFANIELGIPLQRPFDNWADVPDMPLPWATETNARRLQVKSVGMGNLRPSWIAHLEVPYTNTHWDCGSQNMKATFARAQTLIDSLEEDFMAALTDEQQKEMFASVQALLDGALTEQERAYFKEGRDNTEALQRLATHLGIDASAGKPWANELGERLAAAVKKIEGAP